MRPPKKGCFCVYTSKSKKIFKTSSLTDFDMDETVKWAPPSSKCKKIKRKIKRKGANNGWK